ncbi:MAG: phytanoyl-CoA dioxygenase [Cyanobium sp. PLM2.Bin73]|nr:MAG: phytanoyl-CoA dioxygenase [Cyanobium sp. PLM2.Bin73]
MAKAAPSRAPRTTLRSGLRSALRTGLAPLALLSGAKSFRDNPVIGSRRLNRLGLHVGRIRLADALTAQRRWRLGRRIPAADRRHYAEQGYLIRENLLPPEQFEALRQEIYGSDWPRLEMRQGNAITRRVALDRARLRGSHPQLERLLASREIANLIRYVAGTGAEPIFSLQAILAGLPSERPDPQATLHADTFHSLAKAWFFLHDVAEDEGPFAYVPGSQRMTPQRLAWERRQSLEAAAHPITYHARGSFRVGPEDLAAMKLPPPRRFAVKANTLVIADTRGFHGRTASDHPTCRVELYAALRRNPFLPWNGLDPLALPWVRDHIGSLQLGVLERLQPLGLAKMPWKPAGQGPIDAGLVETELGAAGSLGAGRRAAGR